MSILIKGYVEREQALEVINLADFIADERGLLLYADSVQACLLDIPAADVQPVVRGEWKSTHSWTPEIRCSICGYIEPVVAGENIEQPARNYCPNCGARMEVNDDER